MLISKFMTSQPGQQMITYILPNISPSKSNQTMKFGQLIEFSKINSFLQKLCRKSDRERLVSEIFLFFKKALYKVKASGLQLSFYTYILTAHNLAHNKTKLHKTLEYSTRDFVF